MTHYGTNNGVSPHSPSSLEANPERGQPRALRRGWHLVVDFFSASKERSNLPSPATVERPDKEENNCVLCHWHPQNVQLEELDKNLLSIRMRGAIPEVDLRRPRRRLAREWATGCRLKVLEKRVGWRAAELRLFEKPLDAL